MLQHLAPIASDHPGRKLVRLALESFELPGKKGTHICIVHEPLGPTLAELREMAGGQLPADLLKPLVYGMLLGLDYMHAVAHVVHTGAFSETISSVSLRMLTIGYCRYPGGELHVVSK